MTFPIDVDIFKKTFLPPIHTKEWFETVGYAEISGVLFPSAVSKDIIKNQKNRTFLNVISNGVFKNYLITNTLPSGYIFSYKIEICSIYAQFNDGSKIMCGSGNVFDASYKLYDITNENILNNSVEMFLVELVNMGYLFEENKCYQKKVDELLSKIKLRVGKNVLLLYT